jgi:hypothetical protein
MSIQTANHDPDVQFSTETDQIDAELADKRTLHGHPYILGRYAVDAESQAVDALLATGQPNKVLDVTTTAYLDYARQQVGKAIKTAGPELVSKMMGVEKMPEWLRRSTGSEADPTALVTSLAQRTDKGKVSDETALNVMQWHNQRMSDRQKTYEGWLYILTMDFGLR